MVPGGHRQLGKELWTEGHSRSLYLVRKLQPLDQEGDGGGGKALQSSEDESSFPTETNGVPGPRVPRARQPQAPAPALPSALHAVLGHFLLIIKEGLFLHQGGVRACATSRGTGCSSELRPRNEGG